MADPVAKDSGRIITEVLPAKSTIRAALPRLHR